MMPFQKLLFSFFINYLCMMSIIADIYASITTIQCLSHQQFMLLNMKHNLVYNPSKSTKLVHWNQSGVVDCCQWNGVSCNNGHVTGLDLSQESISGGLHNSSSLFNFEHLHSLNLAFNNFASFIPSLHLDLSNAGFCGQIPKGIFHIQTLKTLDVSNNEDLEGSLPEFLQLGQLDTLILSNTNFSGQLVSSISNWKQLSTLDLSNCQFNGTLPDSLSELTNLVHLDLSYNRFSGPIPSFNKSKNLQYLSLLQNELAGTILSTQWEELSNLCIINLGDNFFSGKIPKSLFTIPSLQEFTLSDNGFEGLLDEFQNATASTLELVDLSINKLEGPIPLSLFGLKRLSLLNLSSNKFNGTIHLDTIHKQLPYLSVLGLSNNKLSVEITDDDSSLSSFPNLTNVLLASCNLKKFPSFLKNQPKLFDLDLSSNLIQGPIPEWIWKFDSMVALNLSNNLLTDLEGPLKNPNSSLMMIDLHSNQIRGSIPYFTKYAVHLDLSNNKFSFVPPHIEKYLSFMFFLSLSNNSFQGKIPESFCNCSSIRVLDLSHNNFDGPIPKCLIARNNTLRLLNLAGNKLSGHIYDTIFSSTCNLRYLDLNANLLRGTIPKSLANCRKLEVLNLGNNILSDEFPCFLGNITSLQVLVLRSNRLHGPIDCSHNTSHWKMLRVVDLASNKFIGILPGKLLQSWTAMMDDENYARENGGYLFFNMYDFGHYIHFNDMLALINIAIVKRLAKIFANDPPFMFDDIAELGFTFGIGVIILPLIFWKKWRLWYSKHVDDLLWRIIPHLDFVYEQRGQHKYRTLRWISA
ncbi:hypothetical protein Ahy_B04g071081 [Arachis hypogaea]|uniref:Leucine-rich repeat-containing N-terminal plant-type domain-containing protein n=1 Tax=Arachis hypogaea TaxID=3818 RepID=A0A444ZJZ8_ARAHY|nr:hypothetical protein Ahy_B04g071081 [Arachis hypogaea]